MFDRFTDRARKAMSFARLNAVRLNHDYIGTEHILLGLIDESCGVAALVLEGRDNVDLALVRDEIEKRIQPGPPTDLSQKQLPFTDRAKKVLEFSIDEAREMDHDYVGTEHLILGLLRERDGIAAQILASFNIGLDDLRKEIMEFKASRDNEPQIPGDADSRFQRFTPRALKVFNFAVKQAHRFNHEYLGTEHILYGLIMEGSGVAANVLENLDVDLARLGRELDKQIEKGPLKSIKDLPFTDGAKKVMEFAFDEARLMDHNYVGTEHLLPALIREGEGIAARVLMCVGLTLEGVRKETREFLGAVDPDSVYLEKDTGHRWASEIYNKIRTHAKIERPSDWIWSGFDPATYSVFNDARRAALNHGDDHLGTEHLLLGLCVASYEVQSHGLNPSQVAQSVQDALGPATPRTPQYQETFSLPLTAACKIALELAVKEAVSTNKGRVTCSHLLIGVLQEGKSLCALTLKKYGLTVKAARKNKA